MKKKWLLIFVILVSGINLKGLTEELVPIKTLNVAPWLGPIKDERDLLSKFRQEKNNLEVYIQFDLERAKGLKISSKEAKEIINLMEREIMRTREVLIRDGERFLSMGWKSKTGQVMRTANPVLQLGRDTKGYDVIVEYNDFEIQYGFLKECGNIVLFNVIDLLPPEAEIVPEKEVADREVIREVYVYVQHYPRYVQRYPRIRYYPVYYPRVRYYPTPTHRYYQPTVRTRSPSTRPPQVRTRGPSTRSPAVTTRGQSTRPPQVRTRGPSTRSPAVTTRGQSTRSRNR